jgi:hypothetical protein
MAEHEVTERLVQLPNPDGSLLLRELNHRIINELTSAICAVSATAIHAVLKMHRPQQVEASR